MSAGGFVTMDSSIVEIGQDLDIVKLAPILRCGNEPWFVRDDSPTFGSLVEYYPLKHDNMDWWEE